MVMAWKDADQHGHLPATRAAGLLNVLVEGALVVIDRMPMDRAIGVNMGDFVTVRGGRVVNVAARIAVVIRRGLPCCRLRRSNKCCLKGKRQHSHHHDDGAHTSSQRLCNKPQLSASAPVPKTVAHPAYTKA